jgi:hypothetical protein
VERKEQRMDWAKSQRLDRVGQRLVVTGVLVIDALVTVLALVVGWYASYFSDGSHERGLAALLDVWPVWIFVAGVIGISAMALGLVARGGRIALLLGGQGGLVLASAAFGSLAAGGLGGDRVVVLAVAAAGGLALAAGAASRLASRA